MTEVHNAKRVSAVLREEKSFRRKGLFAQTAKAVFIRFNYHQRMRENTTNVMCLAEQEHHFLKTSSCSIAEILLLSFINQQLSKTGQASLNGR